MDHPFGNHQLMILMVFHLGNLVVIGRWNIPKNVGIIVGRTQFLISFSSIFWGSELIDDQNPHYIKTILYPPTNRAD